MKEVIDPGHVYKLLTLDGELDQTLTFVKRFDPTDPTRFPGNFNAHPGTTMQSVIRCLIERITYLENQIHHRNNAEIASRLFECLWLLEARAAERHGYGFPFRVLQMMDLPMCEHCGHVVCEKLAS